MPLNFIGYAGYVSAFICKYLYSIRYDRSIYPPPSLLQDVEHRLLLLPPDNDLQGHSVAMRVRIQNDYTRINKQHGIPTCPPMECPRL